MAEFSREENAFFTTFDVLTNCGFNHFSLCSVIVTNLQWDGGNVLKIRKKEIKKKNAGFTLIEMLIVLMIITVLLILFVPNLAKQADSIDAKGNEALTKVIETQCEMYYLDHNKRPTKYEELKEEGYISEEQMEKAKKLNIEVK